MKENQLKEARKTVKLTQEEVAQKVEITTRYYQRLEKGDSTPNVKLAKRLANVLNSTIDELFFQTKFKNNIKRPDSNQATKSTNKE